MPARILFTGYAPVHFVCFQPLYERLRLLDGVDVFVSGGLRSRDGANWTYDLDAMYRPFGVPNQHLMPWHAAIERRFDMVFGANTKILTPKDPGVTVQIFHGLSFRNKAIRSAQRADYWFLLGPYMKRRFRAAGILDSDDDPRGLDIGFLKTDRLVDGSLSREALLRRYGLAGDRPVILFAPTGQRGNSLETMGEELLGRLARDGRYDLLIKLHDHPADSSIDWAARIRSMRLGERVGIVTDLDVILPLALSDLLISDASSVSSEYALTGRPIVFLDVPELLASARAAIESQLDLETWGRRGGVVVRSPDEVVPAIAHCLAHPEQRRDVRLKMARDLFFNPGKATEAALAWVQTKLGLA